MHRVLTLALLLLVVPTLELQAQRGHDREDSDSTESSLVRGVSLVGGIGFSLLRLALHRYDDGPAQSFCYTECGQVRRTAALGLTGAPDPYRTSNSWEPLGQRIANSLKETDVHALERAGEVLNQLFNNSSANSGELFEYKEDFGRSRRGVPVPEVPPVNDVPHAGNPCLATSCGTDIPVIINIPPKNGADKPVTWNYNSTPGTNDITDLVDQGEIATIVNPEPSTWALMVAGMVGLVVASRRKR